MLNTPPKKDDKVFYWDLQTVLPSGKILIRK